jgi:putative ATP-dependent endonuclease of OLD family
MATIRTIHLHNFKRYKEATIEVNSDINIFIGDNESGKSTILQAIDLVLSGSRNKVELFGLEQLFNTCVIKSYMNSEKKYTDLPTLQVELYLSELKNYKTSGKNHLLNNNIDCDGIRLICQPNDDLQDNIQEVLLKEGAPFPFEYYSVEFKTFGDYPYSGHNRFVKGILLDDSMVNGEYAMREYVKEVYSSKVNPTDRLKYQHSYRDYKNKFSSDILNKIDLDERYGFAVKNTSKTNLETDLTIIRDDISIENRGKGEQCFIKAQLALKKTSDDFDTVLIEEPENHLSHSNMLRMLEMIRLVSGKQLFITTHNNLICSGLNLQNALFLSNTDDTIIKLSSVNEDTAKFFIKAPNNNLLQFALSKKVILVEGDAENILVGTMFSNIINKSNLEVGVHIISVGGIRFKRYLEIANLLGIRTAVITDNDRNYKQNVEEKYSDYKGSKTIKIFSDNDDSRYTFEVALYLDNHELCDTLFLKSKNENKVQEYMLNNKTESAYTILTKAVHNLKTPSYIKEAIEWINE